MHTRVEEKCEKERAAEKLPNAVQGEGRSLEWKGESEPGKGERKDVGLVSVSFLTTWIRK